ncbi:hypothetical protein NFI96_007464 [Prochilodus magdalenae]|nr:hypothetical protein NFI96_007464 [Prochilodus magdalenae]
MEWRGLMKASGDFREHPQEARLEIWLPGHAADWIHVEVSRLFGGQQCPYVLQWKARQVPSQDQFLQPLLLRDKLMKTGGDMHLVTWITDCLTNQTTTVQDQGLLL